jgi:hypothetical protein
MCVITLDEIGGVGGSESSWYTDETVATSRSDGCPDPVVVGSPFLHFRVARAGFPTT